MKKIFFVFIARAAAALLLVDFGSLPVCAASGIVTAWGGGQPNSPSGLTGVVSISTSADHTLALNANGTVTAWGWDYDGECDVPYGLNNVTAVAAGDFFSLALLVNGTVVAWGADDHGQCDIPPGLNNVVQISAGHAHCLATLSNGSVVAWGWGDFGQTNVPSSVVNPSEIVAAGNYSMALLANGTVVAWGVNDTGQTDVPVGLSGVTQISGAKGYCLAVVNPQENARGGSIASWGEPPLPPTGLNNIIAVAAGEYHGLALTSSYTVLDWGANQSGEGAVPGGLSGVTAIAAGWSYSLALSGSATTVNPNSVTLINPVRSGNSFSVSFQSQNGVSYSLEYASILSPATWAVVQTAAGTGSLLTMTDTYVDSTTGFFRVLAK